MWYRVFGRSAADFAPSELLEALNNQQLPVTGHFKGDEAGWFSAAIHFTDADVSPLFLERYLTDRDDLREDLNTWAAWLETADYADSHSQLMEHVIQTRQLFTFRRPLDHHDEVRLDRLCEATARWLARQTEGVYQIDNRGFFQANGELILTEY